MSITTEPMTQEASASPPAALRRASRLTTAAASLWAVAAGCAIWFMVAAADWEQAHPDVEDHGVEFFVGFFLAGACICCALAWLLPAALLWGRRPAAPTTGLVMAVLSALPVGLFVLFLLGTGGWGLAYALVALLIEAVGVAGVIQANKPECVAHLRAARKRDDE